MSPTLTLRSVDPCPLCRFGIHWFRVASFRINKKSLRQTSPTIAAAAYPSCPECGSSVRRDSFPRKWWLDPEDEALVAETRAQRFGTKTQPRGEK